MEKFDDFSLKGKGTLNDEKLCSLDWYVLKVLTAVSLNFKAANEISEGKSKRQRRKTNIMMEC